jgi:serine phosphatase RsbU (regulator of sigma subunit)
MKTLVRAMVTSAEHQQFHLSQNLLGWMHLNKKALLSNSPRTDERFRGITWDDSIRSILCVPLMVKSELKGVLTAYNKKGEGGFTDGDQRILAIIAMQSAQVIENARLYEQQQAYIRMQEEVRLASTIQRDLLPKTAPQIPGYDIAGRSIPAQMVGGDYFDFIAMDADHLAVCLGDVSGKGLPASLLMANLQATLRGQSLHEIPVNERVTRSNELLYRSTDPEKFATLFYGVLDQQHHTLTYSNAGHENPFLFKAGGEVVRLTVGGTVLGVIDHFPFQEGVARIDPGDLLVVFSDGITEAFNIADEQFGEARLEDILKDGVDDAADRLIERIVEAVNTFAGQAPQADDLTLVVMKRAA